MSFYKMPNCSHFGHEAFGFQLAGVTSFGDLNYVSQTLGAQC